MLLDEILNVILLEWSNDRLLEQLGTCVVIFVVSKRVESTLIVPAEKRIAAADDHLDIQLTQSLGVDACRKTGLVVPIADQHKFLLM